MKKHILYTVLGALTAAGLSGCYDLSTDPYNQYMTEEQKTQIKEDNPEMARASITGITALFSTFCQIASGEKHNDFGVPSVMLSLDARGIDLVCEDIGYNWFSEPGGLDDCYPGSYTALYGWNNFYRQIFAANAALKSINKETEDPELQFYLAQAYALRAYDYFNLAQIFQFTYKGNEDKKCVMIITEENEEEAALNGSPRETVQKTYEQILSDINEAIALLQKSGVKPEKVLDSKPKRFVSLATAYGIRARVNLVMNNWAEAAADAQEAIKAFSGKPMSAATASHPGLNSMDETNWMWGIAIAETDRVVTSGIINWPSHMGSLNYGYASVGAWKKCNIALYKSISRTDVRRNWFLDPDGYSAGLNEKQTEYCEEVGMPPYTQVKFAPYNGELDTSTNANDIPLMRIEEMYYILAEATAMNNGDGASILNAFVQAYRNPSYNFAGSGEAVQEECWMQRRVEFWGEGITTLDLLRLKKPFDRRGGGWEPTWCFNVQPDDNVLIVPLPEREINGNKAVTEADNNPSASMPNPVPDYEY